jgi:hypothetical protein
VNFCAQGRPGAGFRFALSYSRQSSSKTRALWPLNEDTGISHAQRDSISVTEIEFAGDSDGKANR